MTKQIALTPDQFADGWLLHDGGSCPVDAWRPVTIMRRDGKTAKHPDSRFLDWRPYEAYADTDIIAYKPERPDHD